MTKKVKISQMSVLIRCHLAKKFMSVLGINAPFLLFLYSDENKY